MNKKTFALIIGIGTAVVIAVELLLMDATPALICGIIFTVLQAAVLIWAAFARATDGARNLYLAYPRLVVPTVTFALQIVAGVILALALPEKTAVSVAVGIILLAAAIVPIIAVSKATDYAQAVEERVVEQTAFMDDLLSDLRLSRVGITDEATGKALDALIDKVRYSDPRSNAASAPFETKIAEALANGALTADSVKRLSDLVDARNRACKEGK